MKRMLLAAVSCWVLTCVALAVDEEPSKRESLGARELVRQGNQKLLGGDPPAALQDYNAAEELRPDAPEIAFALGLAHLQLQEYDAAREAFGRAAVSDKRKLANDALYSMGTTYHLEALDRMDDPKQTIEKLEHAMQRYEEVLADDPDHEAAYDAIVKAATMRRQVVEMLEQQQQEQQQDSQCDNEGQQDEEQQQESQQQQREDAQEEEKQDQKNPQQEERQQEEESQQPSSSSQGQEEEQEQQTRQAREDEEEEEVSREQAQRRLREMMQAIHQRDKRRQEEEMQAIQAAPVEKDW